MRRRKIDLVEKVRIESAEALILAVIKFLQKNGFDEENVVAIAKAQLRTPRTGAGLRAFGQIIRAYEDMGTIMSTWYSNPLFLDSTGAPLSLTSKRGVKSISNLIHQSHVNLSLGRTLGLMRLSPSVSFDSLGNAVPMRRVFVLPDFEIPRAALIVERFLGTLRKNSVAKRNGSLSLLERSCHVTNLDLKTAGPVLRDIKERGSAFMDSVDNEIEARRNVSTGRAHGELGLVTFAWIRSR